MSRTKITFFIRNLTSFILVSSRTLTQNVTVFIIFSSNISIVLSLGHSLLKIFFSLFEVDFQHEGNTVKFDLKENELLFLNRIPVKKLTAQNSAEAYQPTSVSCKVNKHNFGFYFK